MRKWVAYVYSKVRLEDINRIRVKGNDGRKDGHCKTYMERPLSYPVRTRKWEKKACSLS